MKKLFILCLLILVVAVFAEEYPPLKAVGEPSPTSTVFPAAIGSFQTDWNAVKSIYVFNGSGGTRAAGDLVTWLNTEVTVVTTYDASGAGSGTYDTCAIADSLKKYRRFKLYVYFSNPSNDTIVITGLDSANASQTETIVKASTAGIVYSTFTFWRKVSLAYVTNSNDSIGVFAVPYMTVTTTTTIGDEYLAGIVAASTADDSIMKIHINGIVDVKLLGATTRITPGARLCASGTAAYGIPYIINKPSFGLALSSGNTNTTYPCLIDFTNNFNNGKIAMGSFGSPYDVTSARKYGCELHYSGNNYDVTGLRSRAHIVTTDASTRTAQGAEIQAANSDGVDAGVLNGAIIEAIGKSSTTGARIGTMRGCIVNTEWSANDTITNLRIIHARTHTRDASGDGCFDGAGYGIYIENEAVGGNGQALTSGQYFKGTNISGGNFAFTNGIDFSGATYDQAELVLRTTVAGERTIIASGAATDDAGIVTDVGADNTIADGSIYLSVTDGGGVLFIKKNDVWTAFTNP